MQFFSRLLPNHLQKEWKILDLYEHHWIIEMGDEGIVEAKKYFNSFFEDNEGDF